MNGLRRAPIVVLVSILVLGLPSLAPAPAPARPVSAGALPAAVADNPNPPAAPVRLVFIHHSTGGHWLADPNSDNPYGGLGRALMNNNYYLSATNYGWGPDGIGDRTDIPNWPEWFTGPQSSTILNALYTESGQNFGGFGSWPRLATKPAGPNQIILLKSCFPNSDLTGQPTDPPLAEPNDQYTVANAKAVYNDLLSYFATRTDKLFVVITAPPLMSDETTAHRAANARAFNNWLLTTWLSGYAHNNVAVFDYYNVLTSNGSASRVDDPSTTAEPNDLGRADGNHHRWRSSAIERTQTVNNNFSAYPSGDSHPSTAGQQKATGEFVTLLNIWYHRWAGGAPTATPTRTGAPSATPTKTRTRTPTATRTPTGAKTATPTLVSGQQTVVFQQGVSPSASYGGASDVILAGDVEPNANLGGLEHVETFFGDAENRRSLLRWDISALPAGAKVDSAVVELYRYEAGAENAMVIALYRVTRAWAEGTGNDFWPGSGYVPDGATWSLAGPAKPWTAPGGDFAAPVVSQVTLPKSLANGWVTLDATAAVREWAEKGTPNYGVLIRPLSGQYTYHYFRSREHTVANQRPRLRVTYTLGGQATATRTSVAPSRTTLPLVIKRAPTATPTRTPTRAGATRTATPTRTRTPAAGGRIQPSNLTYVGAFRLPDGPGRPRTFEYGGNAMTFNPDGDPSNADSYPGSLFVMGHDRLPYGELPDGNQVAEVNIPVPGIAEDPSHLPQATFIQDFHDVAAGYFTQLSEIPKVGMQYLNRPATGPKIHLAWGQHLQPQDVASHAWFNPTLATPQLKGTWFIGHQNLYSTNGFMFEIPASWADAHAQSRYLATGRMRDGGQGGKGPALFAYRPWLPGGSAPPSGTHLEETTLLLYESADANADLVRCLQHYQFPDEWQGGAWLTTPSGKSAVLFAGTKGTGTKMWYGYINPRGPQYPCVDQHVTDFDTCRMADGSSCPAQDHVGCCDDELGTCVSLRGWWSTRFDAQFILYDPADLAKVAAGVIEPWEPQPYASIDIDERLYLDPPEWDLPNVGWGQQRRYRIGPVGYDRDSGLLYVIEQYAEGAKPVVHVWRVAG